MKPSETIDSIDTDEGLLELVRHASGDWVILVDRRVLMSSRYHRSEVILAEEACQPLADHDAPRILLAGLGMGYTLRAALDVLPESAEIVTAELNETVVGWCRGPIAELSKHSLDDPRVRLEIKDVSLLVTEAAEGDHDAKYDAIVLDLYQGPYPAQHGERDDVFGPVAIKRTKNALRDGGCLAIWSEGPVASFQQRLNNNGYRAILRRPKYKGPRHVFYLAWLDN